MAPRSLHAFLSAQVLAGKSLKQNSRNRQKLSFNYDVLEPRQLLATGGWVGSYFAGSTPNSAPTLVQHDAIVDFDWGERSGLNGVIDSDGTSARWETNLQSDHTATHQLIVRTNPLDGVRVWANNQLVIDAWSGAGAEQLTANIDLVANQPTPLKIEYRDVSGTAKIWFGWTSPQLPIEVVGPEWTPLSQSQRQTLDDVAARGTLFEQLSSVAGDYLDTGDVDPSNVNNGTRLTSTQASASSSTFAAQKMRGFIVPQVTGSYQFRISGGSQSRLLLADDGTPELARLIASTTVSSTMGQWNVQSTQTSEEVSLVAGVKYYFEARQTSNGTYSGLQVEWKNTDSPGAAWLVVTNDELRPLMGEVGVRAVVSGVNETDSNPKLSFEVSRSDDFGRATIVRLAFGGSATRNGDYTGGFSQVTIPVGQRTVRVNLPIVVDNVEELRETIEVQAVASTEYLLTTPIRSRTSLTIFGNSIPAGASLLPTDPLLLAKIETSGTHLAMFSNRTATNESGANGVVVSGRVLRVQTNSNPNNSTQVRAAWSLDQTLVEGETLYAEFYYRSIAATGKVDFRIRTTSPFKDYGYTELDTTDQWQRAQISFQLGDDLSPGNVKIELLPGIQAGTIEIANFKVQRFVADIANATAVLLSNPVLLANVNTKVGSGTYATYSNRTTTPGESVPFNDVLRVNINNSASFLSQIGPRWENVTSIERDTLVTAVFWMKADSGSFDVKLLFEGDSGEFLKKNLTATNQWTRYEIPFFVNADYAANGAHFHFQMGKSLGAVEIGGFQLWNQGVQPDLENYLPKTVNNYREATNDWRWEAEQAVLDNRRNELTVNVLDLAGNPISGATVNVQQTEHAFGFGNLTQSRFVSDADGGELSSNPETERYNAIAARMFNTIVIADSLRWRIWELFNDRALEAVDWVNANVEALRGHLLAWGTLDQLPASDFTEYERLRTTVSQAAANTYLKTVQDAHIVEEATALAGNVAGTDLPKIARWDVVNHPTLQKVIWDLLGSDSIGDIFDLAKQYANPNTILAINEGQTIETVGLTRRTTYYNLIADLLAQGKPVEAIGFMNHFSSSNATNPIQFKAYLDQFGALGLPLEMTEFDIDRQYFDVQTQADYTEDYFLTVFAHSATIAVTGWGFWEGSHWRSEQGAAWYSYDWEALPMADIWVDLVKRQWQTQTEGSTRTDGSYRTMAFDGNYLVTIEIEGQPYQATAAVDATGGVVNFTIATPQTVTDGTRIQAEGFDLGGEGVAYSDTTSDNKGGADTFRASEGVDIQATTDVGGGYNVGWIASGEWLQYTADVDAGTYDIDFRVAANSAGTKTIEIFVANNAASAFTSLGVVSVPNTNGFQNWTTVTLANVDLSAWQGADRIFRLEFVGTGFNVNWFEFNATSIPANVIGRGVAYGGATAGYGQDAVDPSKSALRIPGSTATAANYTNYSLGLNRVVVDIANLAAGDLSNVSDFEFRVGNSEDPSGWALLSGAALPTISSAVDFGDGVSRVTLAWANEFAIKNSWLQVTVKANVNTGLVQEDAFYFGNQIGDIDGSTLNGKITVNVLDTIGIRTHQSSLPNSVTMTGANSEKYVYDLNRSGTVDVLDTIAARINQSSLGGLLMISLPANSQATMLTAAEPNVVISNFDTSTDSTEAIVAPTRTAQKMASLAEPLASNRESVEHDIVLTETSIVQPNRQAGATAIFVTKPETQTETFIGLVQWAIPMSDATVLSQRNSNLTRESSFRWSAEETTKTKRSVNGLNRLRDNEFRQLNSEMSEFRKVIAVTSSQKTTPRKPVSESSDTPVDTVFADMVNQLAVLFNPLNPKQTF